MRLKVALLTATTDCCAAGLALAEMRMMPNAGQMAPMRAAATDDRQAIAVTPATRIFVLAGMRKMLAAAQGVAEADGKGDAKAVAAAARASGLNAFHVMPGQVMMEPPGDFRALGRQTHMSFDAIADAADSGAGPAVIRAKLGETLQ